MNKKIRGGELDIGEQAGKLEAGFIIAFTVALIAFLVLVPSLASAQVSVQGYFKRDGTYVSPHIRSYPDGNPYNNYGRR